MDNSRNQKRGMEQAVTDAQTAEQMLKAGCTVKQLADALQCSTRNARRVVDVMRRKGCDIPEPPAGIREEWVYKMAPKSKLFARCE
jgi:MarR-like DNA-binding transcriptional regulator SgrR of sgrS sRNA